MKKQHYIIINLLFLGLMIFSAAMVTQFMTGYKPFDIVAGIWTQPKIEKVQTEDCSTIAPLSNLSGSGVESLKKLAVYQQACHSLATGTLMTFLSMPSDQAQAKQYAIEDAKLLKSFSAASVRPLAVIEPTDKSGTNLDFALFANGTYNSATDAYFAQLKSEGITGKQLGIITPFPEANLPYWNNNHPENFSPSVNNYLTIVRKHFPDAETSVLLNSATYDVSDFNWENGDYNSLIPYIKDIKPELITYAGLQGFPWISRQGGKGVIFNASEFLNPSILEEMAEKLKTKKVWFNTGTFSTKYTLDPKLMRTITAQQRKEILMTIKAQALSLKEKDLDVAINIFAEDKSSESEETNWSYWANDDPFSSPHAQVITTFIKELRTNNIDFWLFDK